MVMFKSLELQQANLPKIDNLSHVETWNLYIVPEDCIENWRSGGLLAQDGIYVGVKRPYDKFYQVAIETKTFRQNNFHFDIDRQPAEPTCSEEKIRGLARARENAKARFILTALKAIVSRGNHGLSLCYQNAAPPEYRELIQWAILCRDVNTSKPSTRSAFAEKLSQVTAGDFGKFQICQFSEYSLEDFKIDPEMIVYSCFTSPIGIDSQSTQYPPELEEILGHAMKFRILLEESSIGLK